MKRPVLHGDGVWWRGHWDLTQKHWRLSQSFEDGWNFTDWFTESPTFSNLLVSFLSHCFGIKQKKKSTVKTKHNGAVTFCYGFHRIHSRHQSLNKLPLTQRGTLVPFGSELKLIWDDSVSVLVCSVWCQQDFCCSRRWIRRSSPPRARLTPDQHRPQRSKRRYQSKT